MNRNGCLLALAAILSFLQIAAVNHLDAQELPESILLVDEGEEYTYLKGTEPPPDDWNTLEFDDFEWEIGASGFGYGDVDDNTILDDMQQILPNQPGYLSVYIRKFLNIEDLNAINFIQLGVRYDDGFIAYLNGEELARSASMGAAGI
ncbi:MAG: hypothetical protein MK138_12870, partial [Planctomycetes bacterium]|nr:hypothetical protein [Planctomycetota bacterium]